MGFRPLGKGEKGIGSLNPYTIAVLRFNLKDLLKKGHGLIQRDLRRFCMNSLMATETVLARVLRIMVPTKILEALKWKRGDILEVDVTDHEMIVKKAKE